MLILLGMVGALFIASRIVKPVERMTRRINALRGGDSLFEMEDVYRTNDEIEILNRIEGDVFTASQAVVTIEDIEFLQDLCRKVYISPAIKKYIVDIVQATREPAKYISPNLASYVAMGSSTRAAIAFMEVAKAVALIQGRAYVTPDDVKAMRHEVMRHRIMLNFAAIADGVKEETIVDAIVGAIVTP